MNPNMLTIALPKGRLGKDAIKRLTQVGIAKDIKESSRKLIFEDPKNNVQIMFVKALDVITYVEKGVADIGVVGRDNLLEERPDVYILKDLGFGVCKFSVAGYEGQSLTPSGRPLRVATKYPGVARAYFAKKKQPIETTYLSGSVELGPLVGISDVIVDIVETGGTLKANGLSVLEDMHDVSAKLIANRAKYRIKNAAIKTLIAYLEKEETL